MVEIANIARTPFLWISLYFTDSQRKKKSFQRVKIEYKNEFENTKSKRISMGKKS